MNYILFRASALTLFVACIAGADDPDFAVTFDDLAEFASAFHRRSDFHFTFSLSSLKVFTFQQPAFPLPCCSLKRGHEKGA
jgi:hypothetical protein